MRKLMKNPRLMLALALALCLVLSVTAYVWHRHSAGEELPDIHREVKVRKVLEHPEEYPDLTVIDGSASLLFIMPNALFHTSA